MTGFTGGILMAMVGTSVGDGAREDVTICLVCAGVVPDSCECELGVALLTVEVGSTSSGCVEVGAGTSAAATAGLSLWFAHSTNAIGTIMPAVTARPPTKNRLA